MCQCLGSCWGTRVNKKALWSSWTAGEDLEGGFAGVKRGTKEKPGIWTTDSGQQGHLPVWTGIGKGRDSCARSRKVSL